MLAFITVRHLIGAGLFAAGLMYSIEGAKNLHRKLKSVGKKLEAIEAVEAAYERGQMSAQMRDRWIDTIQADYEKNLRPSHAQQLAAQFKRILKR